MARYRHWALGSPRIPHVGPKQQTARSILMKRYAAAQKVKITETNANITILAYQRGIARSLSNVRERPARSRLLAEAGGTNPLLGTNSELASPIADVSRPGLDSEGWLREEKTQCEGLARSLRGKDIFSLLGISLDLEFPLAPPACTYCVQQEANKTPRKRSRPASTRRRISSECMFASRGDSSVANAQSRLVRGRRYACCHCG